MNSRLRLIHLRFSCAVLFSLFLSHQAEDLAVEVLKGVMEDKIKSTNVEIATVTKERGYYVYSKEEVVTILGRIEE